MDYQEKEHLWNSFLEARGVTPKEACKKCRGLGVATYGSTSTWRGGVGGQMMCQDVCDMCWGSGNNSKPWVNLRKLKESK